MRIRRMLKLTQQEGSLLDNIPHPFLAGGIFTTIGALIIFLSVNTAVRFYRDTYHYAKTEGIISNIKFNGGKRSSKSNYTAYIRYEVNSAVYERASYYSSSMRQGDRVKIHYDPASPGTGNIYLGNGAQSLMFMPIGVIFLLAGLRIILGGWRACRRK